MTQREKAKRWPGLVMTLLLIVPTMTYLYQIGQASIFATMAVAFVGFGAGHLFNHLLDSRGRDEDPDYEPSALPKLAFVGLLLLGGIVLLLLTSDAGSAFNYTKPLAEVVATPDEFAGQPLRVEGGLRTGSIQFREEPCEWRFVIHNDDGDELNVRFPQCVVPDTFQDRPGILVTVQGSVEEAEGEGVHFLANELVPRCPSKYDPSTHEMEGEEGDSPLALPDEPT